MSSSQLDNIDRLPPRGLLRFSKEFFEAFQVINTNEPKDIKLMHVKYYLVVHALELALKSIVRKNGKTIDEIKSYGHDIEPLSKEVIWTNSLHLSDNDRLVISTVNAYYKNKEFEYIIVGAKELPAISDLVHVTDRVIKFAESLIN